MGSIVVKNKITAGQAGGRERPTMHFGRISKATGDAGSQYHCGEAGRGLQPPSTP